jgi:hypothetical protein
MGGNVEKKCCPEKVLKYSHLTVKFHGGSIADANSAQLGS